MLVRLSSCIFVRLLRSKVAVADVLGHRRYHRGLFRKRIPRYLLRLLLLLLKSEVDRQQLLPSDSLEMVLDQHPPQ